MCLGQTQGTVCQHFNKSLLSKGARITLHSVNQTIIRNIDQKRFDVLDVVDGFVAISVYGSKLTSLCFMCILQLLNSIVLHEL